MEKPDKKEKKSLFRLKNLRKYLLVGIIVLIGYLIDKRAFLMFIFIALTFVGKILRGQIGNSMIMFDPLVFFSILIMKFWGFAPLFIFLFLTVFLADAIAGNFTIGSFLNYVLFHICPYLGVLLFGNLSMFVYGNFIAILYSVIYVPIRINFLGGDPFATIMKGVTNIVFVFLYISFLGPVFELIM